MAAEILLPLAYCRRTALNHKARRLAVPGFGHPFHKPDAIRSRRGCSLWRRMRAPAVTTSPLLQRLGKRLMSARPASDDQRVIATLLLEIGIPVEITRAIAVVARAGGLTGHLIEE